MAAGRKTPEAGRSAAGRKTPEEGRSTAGRKAPARSARRRQAAARELPVHLRPSSMALVFLGAMLGVSAREALVLAFPAGHGVPWAVLGINVTGSFALGLLLDALARGGPDRGRRRAARLGLGTGLIGGYTTYSALATDAAGLIGAGSPGPGLAYALATLLAGGVATWLGMAAATLVRQPGAGPAEGADAPRPAADALPDSEPDASVDPDSDAYPSAPGKDRR